MAAIKSRSPIRQMRECIKDGQTNQKVTMVVNSVVNSAKAAGLLDSNLASHDSHIYILLHIVYITFLFSSSSSSSSTTSSSFFKSNNQEKKRVAKFLFKRLFSNKRFRLLPSDIRRVFSDFCPRVLPGKRGEKRTSERKKGRKKERKNK
jgi:hypothetical protein